MTCLGSCCRVGRPVLESASLTAPPPLVATDLESFFSDGSSWEGGPADERGERRTLGGWGQEVLHKLCLMPSKLMKKQHFTYCLQRGEEDRVSRKLYNMTKSGGSYLVVHKGNTGYCKSVRDQECLWPSPSWKGGIKFPESKPLAPSRPLPQVLLSMYLVLDKKLSSFSMWT